MDCVVSSELERGVRVGHALAEESVVHVDQLPRLHQGHAQHYVRLLQGPQPGPLHPHTGPLLRHPVHDPGRRDKLGLDPVEEKMCDQVLDPHQLQPLGGAA